MYGAGERTWTSRTQLLRLLSMPIRVHPHIWSYRRDSNSWPRPYQGRTLPAELRQHMYWLSSVITTIPVRIWRLVPNQLVRPFGRIYRWDLRLLRLSLPHSIPLLPPQLVGAIYSRYVNVEWRAYHSTQAHMFLYTAPNALLWAYSSVDCALAIRAGM